MEETNSFFSASSFNLYAALAAAITFGLATLFRHRSHRSKSPPLPPGPAGLPLVGNLPFVKPEMQYFNGLATVYGPIYTLRLGSHPTIVVSTPTLAAEILRVNDSTFANHWIPAVACAAFYGCSDLLWNPNGPTWRMLRRIIVQEIFSPAVLAAVSNLRRREVRSTVRRLYGQAVAGKAVDVGEEMFSMLLSVLRSVLWGGTAKSEEERSAEAKEFRELVRGISGLLGQPNMSDFFPVLRRFDLQGIERKPKVIHERIDGLFEEMIERKRNEGKKEGKDFLEYLLKLEEDGYGDKTPFTRTQIKALLMDIIMAGTETTSNTLEITLAEMMNKPETITRSQEELDKVVGKNNVVEESHIPKFSYLSAVIKEVLRLHPPAPFLIPHCPSSPCVVGGHMVPQGSRIFINVWAIQRDPMIWKDPSEFRPERFEEMVERKLDITGKDFSYFPFGSGRRMCPGLAMAERMLTYSLASLLHSFDWKLPDGTKLDLSDKFGIVMKKTEPLIAIPIPRLSDPELYSDEVPIRNCN